MSIAKAEVVYEIRATIDVNYTEGETTNEELWGLAEAAASEYYTRGGRFDAPTGSDISIVDFDVREVDSIPEPEYEDEEDEDKDE